MYIYNISLSLSANQFSLQTIYNYKCVEYLQDNVCVTLYNNVTVICTIDFGAEERVIPLHNLITVDKGVIQTNKQTTKLRSFNKSKIFC